MCRAALGTLEAEGKVCCPQRCRGACRGGGSMLLRQGQTLEWRQHACCAGEMVTLGTGPTFTCIALCLTCMQYCVILG